MAMHFYERPGLVDDVNLCVDLPDDFWGNEEGRAIMCTESHDT